MNISLQDFPKVFTFLREWNSGEVESLEEEENEIRKTVFLIKKEYPFLFANPI